MASPSPPRTETESAAGSLDAVAVAASLRRLARQAQPPWLHGEVAQRMAQRLAIVRLQPEAVLEWWGFTGASGALLAAAYPKARRIVVEPNDELLLRSRSEVRSPWWPLRSRRNAPEVQRDDAAPGGVQLLWSNMALHGSPDPEAQLARWQGLLDVGGFVMYSCLGPDTLRELRQVYQQLGWPPPAHEFVDMHDLGDMMVQAGFADPVMDQERLELTWDSPQALLVELRSLGGNASPARWQALRTPRWRERLHAGLQMLARPDGRLGLSFEVVYGHAFKAAPRMPQRDGSEVSLEEMRALLPSARGPRS